MCVIDNKLLKQYIVLLQEKEEVESKINRAEKKLARIREQGTVIDTVTGGMGGIQHFKIEGYPYGEDEKKRKYITAQLKALDRLETKIEAQIADIERFISDIDDALVRQIVNYRILEGMSWIDVANKMGGGNTPDSVKKIYQRYICKNP